MPSVNSFTHNLSCLAGTFTFTNSYAAGGEALTLSPGIAQSTLVVNLHPTGGYLFSYDPATAKVLAYSAPATEVADMTDLSTLGPVPYIAFFVPPRH